MKLNSEAACFQVYSLRIKIFAFTKLIEVRLQKEKKSSRRFLPEGLQKLQKGIFLKQAESLHEIRREHGLCHLPKLEVRWDLIKNTV